MEREIVIRPDNTVSVVQREVVKTVSLDEYMASLRTGEIVTPLLPYGTIQMSMKSGGLRKTFMIQAPPSEKIVSLEAIQDGEDFLSPKSKKTFKFRIWTPWVIYGIRFVGTTVENVWIRFAQERIKSMSDPIAYVALSNVDEHGKVCMGSTLGESINKVDGPDKAIHVIDAFWSSNFVDDSEPDDKELPVMFKGRKAFLPIFREWESLGQSSVSWVQAETYEEYSRRMLA